MAKALKPIKKVKESKTKGVLTPEELGQDSFAAKYEMMFIVSPMLAEEKRKKVVAEINALLEAKNADLFHVDDWGKRDLAYKIKKFTEGYYMIYYFTLADTASIKEIDEHMRLEQSVLRHLILKREDSYEVRDFTIEEVVEEQVETKKHVKKDSVSKEAVAKKVKEVSSDTDSEV
jgi:small subunit ribosomal protein S6